MKRRFTLLAIVAFMSTTVMAQPSQVNGKYQIATKADLEWLAEQVNGGQTFNGEYFEQTADIDLGGIQDTAGIWSGTQWTPIGNNSKQFSGTYDGNGKIIKNLYYNNPAVQYVGLFGGINNATLKNITLASGFVYGYQYTGGICGISKGESEITCCANIATVYGKMERIGGVVGQIDGITDVNNCINYGLVSAYNFAGGVVGGRNKSYNQTVSYCINVGQVFTMRSSGNLYGMNNNGYGTTKCYYDNQINASGGWTFNGSGKETDSDKTGEMEGKPTSYMTSEDFAGEFTEDVRGNWVFTNGMYPRLICNSELPAIILAATPVTLKSGDKADNVTDDFFVSNANQKVIWVSGNEDNLTISNNAATIQRSTSVVLIAKNSDDTTFTKKIYLRTNKADKTPIGSFESPLPISNEADLKELRDAVNNYGSYKGCANYDGFKGIYFEQLNNISLVDWTEPIGIHNSFKGNYNGNNNNLSGININHLDLAIVGGLFGCASYGSIKNLNITSGTVIGLKDVGGLCGSSFREIIDNCVISCTVSTNTTTGNNKTNIEIGGVVGYDKGYCEFKSTHNYSEVTGMRYVGGIMGRSSIGTVVTRCINSGKIESKSSDVGGISGNLTNKDIKFDFCENYGTITGTSNIGGILGSQDSNIDNAIITNCLNTGEIIGTSSGGIIGYNGSNITIGNCLNIGTISAGNGIGGGTNAIIRNSFNAGAANIAIAPSSANIDSCINIGYVTTKVPANCFFDKQLYPNMEITDNNGKKTSEMTGDALKTTLGEDNWIYNEGMYPMPKGLENSDYMKLAATALILDADDNVNAVTKNFTVGTANHVEWTCNAPDKLSFANGHGYISNPEGPDAAVTVNVRLGAIQKSFSLTIKPTTAVVPTMEWNIPADLDINYGETITEEMLSVTISNPNDALSKGHIEYSIAFGPCTLDASAEKHTITATFVPNENVDDLGAASISKKIKINKATATLEWTPEAYTYTYGASDNKSKIESAVAKVNGVDVEGTFVYEIPALTVGEQVVEITSFISTNYILANDAVLTKTINVDPIAASISWATPASIPYGTALTSQQLNAFSPIEGTLVYKIGDEVVTATSGKILNGGSHTITATLTPTSPNYAPATASVTLTVDPILPTIVWENPADITFGTLLSDKQLNAKVDGVSGDFTYTPNFGERLKAEKNITLRVDFTPKGSDANNYKATYKEVKINVNKADAIIDWEYPANITYGTLLSEVQLNANVSGVTGEYNYTPALGAKLNAGKHELKVDFTPTGDDINNCNAASKTVILTVDKATPEITWNIAETIIAGTALTEDEHLNATANIGGSFVYKEGENTINADDVLPAGSHKLTAIFTPADTANYKSKSKSVTVSVAAKTELAITWTAPAPIVYGTLIDSTILNATANIDGTFAYSVKAGDALNAGEHTIVATFTPADNSYSVTTDTVLLQVAKANLIVSVADVTVKQGDALPTFNIAYNGFKLNDNESSLTSQVVATSAASTDKAGTFDIVLSGGQSDNYNFEYQNGKLTITATEDTTAIVETEVAFNVYPNPTDGIFMVETDSNVENIFIYNAQGTLVKVEPNTSKTRIDISDVEQGTYFVKVGEKTIKLLKF